MMGGSSTTTLRGGETMWYIVVLMKDGQCKIFSSRTDAYIYAKEQFVQGNNYTIYAAKQIEERSLVVGYSK